MEELMRMRLIDLITVSSTCFAMSLCFALKAEAAAKPKKATVKEWTFLTFLNGNNNLDSFGALNINQMEQVGSTDQINIVVQWASLRNRRTQRLYITKDKDT